MRKTICLVTGLLGVSVAADAKVFWKSDAGLAKLFSCHQAAILYGFRADPHKVNEPAIQTASRAVIDWKTLSESGDSDASSSGDVKVSSMIVIPTASGGKKGFLVYLKNGQTQFFAEPTSKEYKPKFQTDGGVRYYRITSAAGPVYFSVTHGHKIAHAHVGPKHVIGEVTVGGKPVKRESFFMELTKGAEVADVSAHSSFIKAEIAGAIKRSCNDYGSFDESAAAQKYLKDFAASCAAALDRASYEELVNNAKRQCGAKHRAALEEFRGLKSAGSEQDVQRLMDARPGKGENGSRVDEDDHGT